MANKFKLKEAFDVESKHGAFYTGGNVEWHANKLFCQTSTACAIFDIDTGSVAQSIGEDKSEDADTIHTFTSNGLKVVTAHKSGLLKLWDIDGTLEKTWKGIHKGPVARLRLKNLLASGGSDGVVRLWDMEHQACLLGLKGCFGVVNLVEFHPVEDILFASGDDGKINSWQVDKGEMRGCYSAHFSKVTSLAFHYDQQHFVSAGRDKVLILWHMDNMTAIRTIPVYEVLESVLALPIKFKLPNIKIHKDDGIYVATGGEKGVVRVWNVIKSQEIFVQTNSLVTPSSEGGLAITQLLYDDNDRSIAVVSADQNIIIHALKTFICTRQFVGFTDEILDLTFVGDDDSHLAVATNSCDIKLYENRTMSCTILKGHTDLVLALAKAAADPNMMLSSSKDNSIRLWLLDANGIMHCQSVATRHTASVGAICFPNATTSFAVSGSQDTCVKVWEIAPDHSMTCARTEIAHQKDVNSIAVSPNDQIIATASQDKTAKLWSNSLELLGVLRGHKRGVWCIRFSPTDQVVVTSSADCSIKLWSVAQLNCLKTIEGHESSVLRCEFLTNGMQIISAGADGLLKLFNVKTSECQLVLDEHEARIWALAARADESGLVTGGSDSVLIKWRDVTVEKQREELRKRDEFAVQEQNLSNYIQGGRLLKALKLALRLEKPSQVLRIVNGLIKGQDGGLTETIKELRDDQKQALFKCAIEWNTNSRNAHAAQLVLNVLLNEIQQGQFHPVGLAKMVEGALPYTERHFRRLTQSLQDLHFLAYTINCMQPHAKITN